MDYLLPVEPYGIAGFFRDYFSIRKKWTGRIVRPSR